MVSFHPAHHRLLSGLSVLALSSRFDGHVYSRQSDTLKKLSVLALSSRFDGPGGKRVGLLDLDLSVLALSSRFDGRYEKKDTFSDISTFSTRSVESF